MEVNVVLPVFQGSQALALALRWFRLCCSSFSIRASSIAAMLHEAALKGNAVAYDVLYLFRTDFSYLITALGKVAQYAPHCTAVSGLHGWGARLTPYFSIRFFS